MESVAVRVSGCEAQGDEDGAVEHANTESEE